MNRASHNPSGSARQTEFLANQLDRLSVPCDDESSQISSAGQGREERDREDSCSSRAFKGSCAALVHELANTTTAVLMNAQVLGWKLPPYSRLKRPLLEIERNAQRGSELMKCLFPAGDRWNGPGERTEAMRAGPRVGVERYGDGPGAAG